MKSLILIIGTNMMSIYNHRLELIKYLLKSGYRVAIAAPRGGEEQALVELGVEFINTPVDNRGTNIKKDLFLVNNLVHIIKKEKPSVVLTFYTKTNIYGGIACRLTSTPYIENITGLGSAVTGGGVIQKIMISLYRAAVKSASIVFFQNRNNLKFFQDHNIQVRSSRLLPGSGVSLTRFTPLEYPSSGNVEFLFISRILREKGIEEYINAAREIKKKYQNVVFHVVGPCDGAYVDYVNSAVAEGVIVYHGKQFDIKPFIAKSHCIVFPSYYAEGMANVLLESAACARPIITTSLPGCGETVEDGKTGFVVREKDYKDLVAQIEKFLNLTNQERLEMGQNGRKKMEREFDRNIVIEEYGKEIDRLIK